MVDKRARFNKNKHKLVVENTTITGVSLVAKGNLHFEYNMPWSTWP